MSTIEDQIEFNFMKFQKNLKLKRRINKDGLLTPLHLSNNSLKKLLKQRDSIICLEEK